MEVIELLGLLGIVIFVFLCIILPISVYCAQKWAYKCYLELRKLNLAMEMLLDKER